MKEEEIDKLLKNKINSDLKAPESLKKRISYEIKNIKDPKKSKTKFKIMQSVAAVIVVSVLGVTTYATITKNPILEKLGLIKGSTTYEEIAKDINEDLSNEYANITLKRMASDNAYIIMEYNVKLKNTGIEKFGDIEKDKFTGYNIGISNTITINNEEIDIALNRTEYVNKISNTEFEIYQLINIANINSKNLDIEISEKYLTSNGEQIEINKIVSIQAKKNENIEPFQKIEKKLENKTIIIENFLNTSFETYVKISVDITNVKESDMNSIFSENYPNNIAFTVLDNQNNYISNKCYMKKAYIKDNSGNKIDILNSYDEENKISYNQATAHLEYIITLGNIDKNIKEIKIVPFVCIINDERSDDYGDYYNNLTWYKIQEGEYSQTGKLGGKVKINNIEVTDEKIRFSYSLSGFITGKEDMVLLRINDSNLGFNVIYPSNYYNEKLNSEENYVEFDRNEENVGIYSYNFEDEEDYKLKDISKIEFALLAEPTTRLLDAEIKLTIPEKKECYLEINKIEINNDKNENTIVDLKGINNVESEITDIQDVNNIMTNNNVIIENKNSNLSAEKFNETDNELEKIKLGMKENQVKEILGEPLSIDSFLDEMNMNKLLWEYENISIEYKEDNGTKVVRAIRISGENMKGPRGIKIGDRKEDVIKKFYSEKNIIIEDNCEILYRDEDASNNYGMNIYSTTVEDYQNIELIEYYGEEITFTAYISEYGTVFEMTLETREV